MENILAHYKSISLEEVTHWFKAAHVEDFPKDGGACIKYKELQIAVFYFAAKNNWYACQNLCPHKYQMILARGMTGEVDGEPKVACPFHKRTFSLQTGKNFEGTECDIAIYPVKTEAGYVYIGFDDSI